MDSIYLEAIVDVRALILKRIKDHQANGEDGTMATETLFNLNDDIDEMLSKKRITEEEEFREELDAKTKED